MKSWKKSNLLILFFVAALLLIGGNFLSKNQVQKTIKPEKTAEEYNHTSSSVFANGQEYHLSLVSRDYQENPPDLQKEIACLPTDQKITGGRGNFRLVLRKEAGGPIIDETNLGITSFAWETEQDGRFTSQTLKASPKYDTSSLAIRVTCNQNLIRLFGVDPKNDRIVEFKFYRKNGQTVDLLIPSGYKIPQQDSRLNMIYDVYNQETGKRDKIRFQFNSQDLAFYEIESWSQSI